MSGVLSLVWPGFLSEVDGSTETFWLGPEELEGYLWTSIPGCHGDFCPRSVDRLGRSVGQREQPPKGEVESVAWLSSGSREGQKLREVWDRLEGGGSTLAYGTCGEDICNSS